MTRTLLLTGLLACAGAFPASACDLEEDFAAVLNGPTRLAQPGLLRDPAIVALNAEFDRTVEAPMLADILRTPRDAPVRRIADRWWSASDATTLWSTYPIVGLYLSGGGNSREAGEMIDRAVKEARP